MTDTDLRPDGPQRPPSPAELGVPVPQGPPEPAAPWQPVAHPGLRLVGVLASLVVLGVWVPWVLAVILGLLVMIFLHELGHFVMARRADMKVTEFFIGFGPRIWSFKRGEVEYGLKAIPAGAYVKIIGMTNLEEVLPADEVRAYRQKTFGQRVKVAVAGSTMHFLLALVLIFVLLTTVGVPGGTVNPDPYNWRVGKVYQGSGAAAAGIMRGDKLLTIDGKKVGTLDGLASIVVPLKGKTVPVRFERSGTVRTTQVSLGDFKGTEPDGTVRTSCCVGISQLHPKNQKVGALEAVPRTLQGFGEVARLSVLGVGKIFSPSGISGFAHQVANAGDSQSSTTQPAKGTAPAGGQSTSGSSTNSSKDLENRPVSIIGIVNLGSQFGADGASSLVGFFALVNIFIGLFNLIPLLPFDGGHVAIAVYEKAQELRLRRRGRYFVDAARLMPLTYVVVGLLGLLFLSSAYLDILSPIKTN